MLRIMRSKIDGRGRILHAGARWILALKQFVRILEFMSSEASFLILDTFSKFRQMDYEKFSPNFHPIEYNELWRDNIFISYIIKEKHFPLLVYFHVHFYGNVTIDILMSSNSIDRNFLEHQIMD